MRLGGFGREEIDFDNIKLTETFFHEGLEYQATLSPAGVFSFHLVRGNSRRGSAWPTKKGSYNLFPEEPVVDDVDLTVNALPVFRKAGVILLNWVWARRPFRIAFVAATDRKLPVYRWLARRLAAKIRGYSWVEDDGVFNFYRVVK